ncbi:MAG: hypothetical protein GXP27_05910 [Planctomycetes bacterium]|nr:hypothetical protein [Planctomycetota bacterium]
MAKPADQIRLLDIHEAVEGPVGESDCLLGNRPCNRSECLLSEMIQSVHEQVRTYLRETTLEQLARRVGFLSWEGSDP